MAKNYYKKERAKYIIDYVNKSESTTKAVIELTQKLFISERTVYNDLKENINTAISVIQQKNK